MRHYEILTILPGTLAETEVSPLVEKMKEMIEAEGATALQVESGGKSRLAYPVKHIRYGYFHVFTFEAEPEMIKKVEEKMRLFGQVLRTVIRTFDPSKREAGKTMVSMLGIDEEKDEKKDENFEKMPVQEEIVAPTPVVAEEKNSAAPSEEKTAEVDMKDFDKQLDAILDDKIAGL